jgi:hypothetical protein
MSIDNPLEARRVQIQAQKREELIPSKVRKSVITLTEFGLRLLKAKAEYQPLDIISAVGKMFNELRDQVGQSNVDYMIDGIAIEIQWLEKQYEALEADQRRFLDEEWPRLVVKAVEENRYTTDQRRLDRVIAILTNAGRVADPFSGDRTELLVRIAVELGDAELHVLKRIYDTQNAAFEKVALANGRSLLRPGEIDESWKSFEEPLTHLERVDLPSLCRTLESYGLVASVGGGASSLAAYGPWSLLMRGKELVENIRAGREQN